jgi:hypothetical protein
MKNFLLSIKPQKVTTYNRTNHSIINTASKHISNKATNLHLSKSILKNNLINKTNQNNNLLIKISKRSFSKVNYTYDTRDFLSKTSDYESQIDDLKSNYSYSDIPIKGFATSDATEKYTKRNTEEIHKDHFRTLYNENIKVSSMGLGTYIGAPDDINDFYIYNAVKTCVLSGAINVIDTAINYRYMKSEKAIGRALNALVHKYNVDRQELLVCSKIGYVPEDAEGGRRAHSFVQELVEDKKMEIDDVVFDEKNRPVHCMHPEFLEQQLNFSLKNLGLETLDVMYLHNVVESQGAVLTPELFEKKLTKAFEFMVIFIKFIFLKIN